MFCYDDVNQSFHSAAVLTVKSADTPGREAFGRPSVRFVIDAVIAPLCEF